MLSSSLALVALLLDASLKSLLIAAAAWAALALLRIRDSNVRHRVWTAVLAGMLLLPVLTPVAPGLVLPVDDLVAGLVAQPDEEAEATEKVETRPIPPPIVEPLLVESPDTFVVPRESPETIPTLASDESFAAAPPIAAPSSTMASTTAEAASKPTAVADAAPLLSLANLQRAAAMVLLVYFTGLATFVARLLIGLVGARRLVRTSQLVDVAQVTELLSGANTQHLRRVAVRESERLRVPATVGWLRPCVLLPTAWRDWSREKLLDVLEHELTHVARRDYLVAMLAEVNRCLYWFHPLSWLLIRRLADLAECNCDDAVIAATGGRAQYARHLLEIAASAAERWRDGLGISVSMARSADVESRILAVLNVGRPLARRLGWRGTLMLLALAAPAILLSAGLRARAGEKPPSPDDNHPPLAESESPELEKAADPNNEETPVRKKPNGPVAHVARGQVVDETGKPVPNATVYVFYSGYRIADSGGVEPEHEVYGRSATDAEGRFAIPFQGIWIGNEGGTGSNLVATADGFAPAWLDAKDCDLATPVTLRLERASKPVVGRILDLEGRPLAGVKVAVKLLAKSKPGGIDDWLADLPSLRERGLLPKPDPSDSDLDFESDYTGPLGRFPVRGALIEDALGLPKSATTGDDGKFQIDDVGDDRLLLLQVQGPSIVSRAVQVVTRTMPTVEARGMPAGAYVFQLSIGNSYYGRKFDYIAEPSPPVEGVVRDADSGRPIAGAKVVRTFLPGSRLVVAGVNDEEGVVTDEEGRFRYTGLPRSSGSEYDRLTILPREDQPYFRRIVEIPRAESLAAVSLNVELKRGVWVTGRLTERETGNPVETAYFDYYPLLTNPHAKEYGFEQKSQEAYPDGDHFRIGESGNFRTLAIPGQGILAVRAGDQSYRTGTGAESIDPRLRSKKTFATYGYCHLDFHQLIKLLDIAEDAKEVECNLAVETGPSLVFELFDPQGRPISGARWSGLRRVDGGIGRGTLDGNRAVMESLSPDWARTPIFEHRERGLAAAATIAGVPDDLSPRKLTLQPTASIVGRIVDGDKQPVESGEFMARLNVPHAPAPLQTIQGAWTARAQIGPDGRFRCTGVIPGFDYRLRFNLPQSSLKSKFLDGELAVMQPGEVINLGDIDAETGKRLSADPPSRKQAATGKAVEEETFTFSGRVTNIEGEPLAGATVLIDRAVDRRGFPQADHATVARVATDAKGRYRIVFTGATAKWFSTFQEKNYGWGPREAVTVVALADKCAPVWKNGKDVDLTRPLELKLPPAGEPIRGRILDVEGEPVAGATATVRFLAEAKASPDGDAVDRWLAELPTLRSKGFLPKTNPTYYEMAEEYMGYTDDAGCFPYERALPDPPPALQFRTTSDENGRFALPPLGDDRLVGIQVLGPTIEMTLLNVVSRDMPPAAGRWLDAHFHLNEYGVVAHTYHGRRFDYIAGPSIPVSGVVRDKDSGAPLPGVRIVPYQLAGEPVASNDRDGSVITDDDGKFVITGLPKDPGGRRSLSNQLMFIPSDDLPYFHTDFEVPLADGRDVIEMDVPLKRGVWITGRVSNRQTGEGVANTGMSSSPLLTNEHALQYGIYEPGTFRGYGDSRFTTSDDGSFRILGMPGKNILGATYRALNRFRRGLGADQIGAPFDAERNQFATYSHTNPAVLDALKLIDIPADVETFSVDLEVDPGETATLELVDPAGRPLTGVKAAGLTPSFPNGLSTMLPTSRAVVKCLSPDSPRALGFYHAERRLAKLIELDELPADDEVRRVTLTPCAVFTGRVVDAEGKPATKAVVNVSSCLPDSSNSARRDNRLDVRLQAEVEEDGSFRCDAVADCQTFVRVLLPGVNANGTTVVKLETRAGETIDLGDINAESGKRLSAEPPKRSMPQGD